MSNTGKHCEEYDVCVCGECFGDQGSSLRDKAVEQVRRGSDMTKQQRDELRGAILERMQRPGGYSFYPTNEELLELIDAADESYDTGRREERERIAKLIRARQDQVDDHWKRFLVTTDYRTAVWALGDDLVAALEEPKP